MIEKYLLDKLNNNISYNVFFIKSSSPCLYNAKEVAATSSYFNISDFKYKNTLLSECEITTHCNNIYFFEFTKDVYKVSAYTTFIMRYAVHHNNVEYINKFIEALDKTYLTSWSLIALLRSTSICKNDITEWEHLFDFSAQKIMNEGLNPRKELYGLKR